MFPLTTLAPRVLREFDLILALSSIIPEQTSPAHEDDHRGSLIAVQSATSSPRPPFLRQVALFPLRQSEVFAVDYCRMPALSVGRRLDLSFHLSSCQDKRLRPLEQRSDTRII